MSDAHVIQWDDLISGAFALDTNAFRQIVAQPNGLWLAIAVVVLAGLSLGVGQSIILFINRVKPTRFVLSLLLNAVLFTGGFIALVLSTWLIGLLPWSVYVPFLKLLTVLGLAYIPLLFSFLGALPYCGYPINTLLAIWNLLAITVGFAAVAQVGASTAFSYVACGWFVKQLLEGTIGQPIADLGRKLSDRVAGVEVARTRSELRERIAAGAPSAQPIIAATSTTLPEVRQFMQASKHAHPNTAPTATLPLAEPQPCSSTSADLPIAPADPLNPLVQVEYQTQRFPQPLKLALGVLTMVSIFVIVFVLLRPIRNNLFGWYATLPIPLRLVFNLVWIGVVGIVFAGILAPLESLGWWAGWYGEAAVAPTDGAIASAAAPPVPIERYVVYLDGIGQSGEEYTPDVDDFLVALKPALPDTVELVQGLMMYSVLNKPLGEDRPLAFLWRMADTMRWRNPTALLGILVNLRNVIIVAVSSDKRYGPIYNQGIAQVVVNGLIQRGYQPGSGTPITLVGYSGGGEMSVACAPYVKRSLGAPIDVISLGGVMSANNNVLKLEHLYHIVGEKDSVERLGPIMFPGRWPLFPLSFWNRAKRKGKITVLSAGPVGHQVPGGYMDPNATLPNGQTHLQHTIAIILQILRGEALRADHTIPRKPSNYALYQEVAFNRPDYYPIAQPADSYNYCPIGDWVGRLILPKPEQRSQVNGALFEVHHAPHPHRALIGREIPLRWATIPAVQKLVNAVTKDIHFSVDAEFSSTYGGSVHPDRLNHWQQVDPLESLAGAHPVDDLIVKLNAPVEVTSDALYIQSTPVQITGRFYALVQFVQPIAGTDQFQVVHFDRAARQFVGKPEVMRLPAVKIAEAYGSYPSTTRDIERLPLNEKGWYVYGAMDAEGLFVVQSLAPRALFQLQPNSVTFGRRAAYRYIRKHAWADIVAQKGKISSVLCTARSNSSSAAIKTATDEWRLGDRALVLHTYGGIGGNQREPAAATPIFFGHFAYGIADVIHDPLADELRFDICYHQVYTQNTDGLVAGTLHWSRYMGDRQFGWVGTRPVCDILVKLSAFTDPYPVDGERISPLGLMMRQLQVMTARYRIGDGTGGTYVGPANNCSQDSNQALFASIHKTARSLKTNPHIRQALLEDAEQRHRFQALEILGRELNQTLRPLGSPRSDWEQNEYNLGSTLEDAPLRNLWTGLGSWRTMLPRLASDTIVKCFLRQGASVWVLRTNQIGGYDPEIEPIAPMTL